MKIIGNIETIGTGTIERTEVDAIDFRSGHDAIARQLPDNARLISIWVER
ncbi:MAG: hypothetical protein WBX27_18720 [Specibacter sp.]